MKYQLEKTEEDKFQERRYLLSEVSSRLTHPKIKESYEKELIELNKKFRIDMHLEGGILVKESNRFIIKQ